ncbi:MAG: hypothetical protein EOM80_03310 [Erysipelotrichia bacterium]|nr:hypothetical protein [Erysipelotrichia bacterium]
MRKYRSFAVFVLLLASLTMTGCDASKIIDVISNVAKGVSEAIPKIKEVIDTVSNAIPQNTDTATDNTANTGTEENAGNNANVTITNPGDDEEIAAAPANTTAQTTAAATATGGNVALKSRIAGCIKNLVNSTSFRGSDVDGGNLACAKVVSTALKSAGVLSRVSLNCDGVVADLKAVGWKKVSVPPYQEGDVVTWTTSRGPGRHIGIIVKQGSTYKAISNSSSQRTPRVHEINYMPITQVLRKA